MATVTSAAPPASSAHSAIDGYLTWVEIDRDAYGANVRFFRNLLGEGVELSAVVKANAYGHGASAVASLAADCGVDSFCVHSLEEALALRADGHRQNILVMGHVPFARLAEALRADLRLVIFQRESLDAVIARAEEDRRTREKPVRIHLKLETGTHRHGILESDLGGCLEALRGTDRVILDGAYTHFANIEDTTDHGYAREQLRRFEAMLEHIRSAGFAVPTRHTACSAAALVVPETRFDMVRLGISQYGFWPSKETLLSFRDPISQPRATWRDDDPRAADPRPKHPAEVLQPALTWKTRVSQLKEVPAGAYVGYGCTYQTTRPTRLAVLPIGYSDGYDRRLSNQAYVLVGGHRAPVRGRVCMNLTLVDVTDVPDVGLEDEVVLLGRQGQQDVSAEQLGAWIGTIHYEVLARIRGTIPRVIV